MAGEPLIFDADLTLRAQIQARADHPTASGKVFLKHHDRTWTFRQFRDEATRVAHFLLRRLGRIDDAHPGHVAMLLENHLELLSLYGGCGIAGVTLFGVNTGLRGRTLAGVLNQSRARLLVVDERFAEEVEKVRADLQHVGAEDVLYLRTQSAPGALAAGTDYLHCLASEVAPEGASLEYPEADVTPGTNLMIIYTSGTTGLPKGIINNHFKLCATGIGVSTQLQLGQDDCGYACMPLFHSNSMFIGFMPTFWVGASLGIRERFSASNFVPDVVRYGVTYWNYVGEPVHYVLQTLQKQYGGDLDRLRAEVTNHPDNHLRYAIGNGASPPDIDRFVDWLGLEDMFELYGSTEAAIATYRRLGDPRGSVGEITDPAVKILDSKGDECPPAELGSDGRILNYEEAVGEICRVAGDTALFQGYFDNPGANSQKYRDGVYHSGDLGHILVRDGKRYLFFDGRTDDWIRKDGENFSALQVARLLSEHPDIPLVAAYGVPCAVSDELVMAAVKMREGATFDPQAFFDFCERQVTEGGMDRKWFPDFVRVVEDFEYTGTQKILVRNLKAVHFDPHRIPDPLFWRERGDRTFKPLTSADYARLRDQFAAAEKLPLLER
ncbi:MAG TPA: AMP-binding protein [Candidatus Limnocylindrales bacterium]|nr:AMP-binding protein [Candidatus Limnocylindrales bacterium]